MNTSHKAVLIWFAMGIPSAAFCLFSGCANEASDSGGPSTHLESSTQDIPVQNVAQSDAATKLPDAEPLADIEPIPKTAEELLARIDAGPKTDQLSELTPDEVDKAVTILRKRYPLVSIRDRLSFQSQDPIGPPKKPGRNNWQRSSEEIHSNRPRSLEALHSEKVKAFINSSGFGFNRGPFPNPYDLKLGGDYAEQLISRPVDSGLLGEALVALPEYVEPTNRDDAFSAMWSLTNGMPNNQLTYTFHQFTNRDFASADSTGFVKNLDNVAGFQAHRIRHQKDWDGSLRIWDKEKLSELTPKIKELDVTWRVNRLQLVGLLIHPTPRVYVSEKLPDMEELSSANAESRRLNEFETNGLEKLIRGENTATIATPNRIVMLGSIRAGNSCLNCHSVKPDQLLGAFSYELLREPRLELNSDPF